jgi:hypothetical protein
MWEVALPCHFTQINFGKNYDVGKKVGMDVV